MYAIVSTGGKKYRSPPPMTSSPLRRLRARPGFQEVELEGYLPERRQEDRQSRDPARLRQGLKVTAGSGSSSRARKLLVYKKFHKRKRYRPSKGQRQQLTKLKIHRPGQVQRQEDHTRSGAEDSRSRVVDHLWLVRAQVPYTAHKRSSVSSAMSSRPHGQRLGTKRLTVRP